MTIPSPCRFIEFVLCFLIAAVVLFCLAFVLVVIAVFAAVETLVDRLGANKRRQIR